MAMVGAALALGGPVRAELLVDTGPGGTSSVGAWSLFHNPAHFQYLAGKFTLAEPADLSSVEGWMGPFGSGGSIEVKIRAGGSVPGAAIYSKTYVLGTRIAAGWDVFADFDVALPAGTYWLAFEPVPGTGFNYSMPPGAPSPLPSYAYLADGNPGWVAATTSLGMRVSGTAVAAAPLGTGTRTIVVLDGEFPDGTDRILDGTDDPQTIDWNINLSGHGWSAGVGTIFANWLEAGAEAVSSAAYNAARAVAWRSFENTSGQSLSFRINAVLDGEYADDFGATNQSATAGINALDSNLFASTIASSGVSASEFLLRDDALNATTGAADRINLATLFPVAARLGGATVTVPFVDGPIAVPLQTTLITIAPGETFTLLFDVSALSAGSGTGGTQFFNTLEPGPVLFTDENDDPVVGIEVLGTGLTVGEASFLMWESGEPIALGWEPAAGATSYRLYRGTGDTLPGLLDGSPDSCLRFQGSGTSTLGTLTEIPPPGTFFWYVVAGVDGPTQGSAGEALGAERVVNSTGSCP
jgi:hypothetical protein